MMVNHHRGELLWPKVVCVLPSAAVVCQGGLEWTLLLIPPLLWHLAVVQVLHARKEKRKIFIYQLFFLIDTHLFIKYVIFPAVSPSTHNSRLWVGWRCDAFPNRMKFDFPSEVAPVAHLVSIHFPMECLHIQTYTITLQGWGGLMWVWISMNKFVY